MDKRGINYNLGIILQNDSSHRETNFILNYKLGQIIIGNTGNFSID